MVSAGRYKNFKADWIALSVSLKDPSCNRQQAGQTYQSPGYPRMIEQFHQTADAAVQCRSMGVPPEVAFGQGQVIVNDTLYLGHFRHTGCAIESTYVITFRFYYKLLSIHKVYP